MIVPQPATTARQSLRILYLFAFASSLLLPLSARSAYGQPADAVGHVDKIFAEWNDPDAPGVQVVVMQGDRVAFSKGYGLADIERGLPMTPNTPIYIGSAGKQFTAFAVALLASQGKLSLDDEVRKHIPELPEYDAPLTIRHLLHHTSGVRDYFALLALAGWREGDLVRQKDIVRVVTAQRELNFTPGTSFSYSNSNYALLATIVERVTGAGFGEWMRANVFDPLGMDDTYVADDVRRIVKGRAESYGMSGGEGSNRFVRIPDLYEGYGAGGIYSTANDLTKWVRNFSRPVVGNEKVIRQMHERGRLANGDTLDYAFALILEEHRGAKLVWHGGAFAGFRSYVGWFPEHDLGIIVLANLDHSDPQSTALEVADIYLDDAYPMQAEPVSTGEDEEEPKRTADDAVAIDPAIFDDYAGDYALEVAPDFVLTFRRDGDRFFSGATGQEEQEIYPSSDSTFFLTVVDASVTFHREPDGNVSSLTLHQGGRFTAHRHTPYKPSTATLREYAGAYYSPELDVSCRIALEGDTLHVQHGRHDMFALLPDTGDRFSGEVWFFDEVTFERDEENRVTGMRITSGRAAGMWFGKVD